MTQNLTPMFEGNLLESTEVFQVPQIQIASTEAVVIHAAGLLYELSRVRFKQQLARIMGYSAASLSSVLKDGRKPHPRFWKFLLTYAKWADVDRFPVLEIRAVRAPSPPDNRVHLIMKRQIPGLTVPEHWAYDSRPMHRVISYLTNDVPSLYSHVTMLIAPREHLDLFLDSQTSTHWLRLAEMYTWFRYGYPLREIYEIDWNIRELSWHYSHKPKHIRYRGLTLPADPMEIIR